MVPGHPCGWMAGVGEACAGQGGGPRRVGWGRGRCAPREAAGGGSAPPGRRRPCLKPGRGPSMAHSPHSPRQPPPAPPSSASAGLESVCAGRLLRAACCVLRMACVGCVRASLCRAARDARRAVHGSAAVRWGEVSVGVSTAGRGPAFRRAPYGQECMGAARPGPMRPAARTARVPDNEAARPAYAVRVAAGWVWTAHMDVRGRRFSHGWLMRRSTPTPQRHAPTRSRQPAQSPKENAPDQPGRVMLTSSGRPSLICRTPSGRSPSGSRRWAVDGSAPCAAGSPTAPAGSSCTRSRTSCGRRCRAASGP